MNATLTVETRRFGSVPYGENDLVTFDRGLVGFPHLHGFLVIQHAEDSPFRWLQSVEDGEVSFLVVDPAYYLTDFAPDMPPSVAADLQLEAETAQIVYTVVTIPAGEPELLSLNLAGPLILNAESRKAAQIVLEDDRWPIRFQPMKTSRAKADAA